MLLKPQQFYNATNPAKTLDISKQEDKSYYVDFSAVRGGELIAELKDKITWSEDFTCHLFTGHIGCGKSTELYRLKSELEAENYHVIYFEATDDLDMGNVEVSDILLAIARRTAQELETLMKQAESGWQGVMQKAKNLLFTEIKLDVKTGEIPGVGKFELGVDFDNNVNVGLSTIIGEIKAQSRKNANLQDRLRNYLEPKTDGFLDVLNNGLFIPINDTLKANGKNGLVIIIDGLDKLINTEKSPGKTLPAYLFGDRGDQLSRLACHVVYTMPLALCYSDEYTVIRQKFKNDPIILPMIRVKNRDGEVDQTGINLLYLMVLSRAFSQLSEAEKLTKIGEIFDGEEPLKQLCEVSGGHVRNLLIILNSWIIKEKKFPLSSAGLEAVVVNQVAGQTAQLTPDEWELLNRVHQTKDSSGDRDFSKLIRTLLVYEYRDEKGAWYEVNPILFRTEKIQ
ncbi:ATP-binding protein [Planktothricoides raciborskii]|uniref:ATP-binding protein n=2 Tax=Planktothricoides raciborskii TaxID=132608 RepID=A0AAU8JA66_9CYAN|nr:ATP-binding protein [Planktothricoides raciborskii]MBD2543156.1 ATP-binding protein [Planktothricoides raciborskii FACHB-1370]MBD2580929.1 ATP-binding protein [Planktothricoides raciborskii FACHB-1261]